MVDQRQDAQALATAASQAMWARDNCSQGLGMELTEVTPGGAVMRMRVRPDMTNGHKTCHGGFVFMLADSAFAFACNSYNLNTVGSACTIDYLAPAFEGDMLEAVAVERSTTGRTGVYDVTVRKVDGPVIALFRGKSYRVRGEVIAGLAEAS